MKAFMFKQILLFLNKIMTKNKIKKSVLDLLEKLPEDINYEDIIAEIYFKKQVEEGIEQLEKGQTLSNEDVKKRMEKWLK